MATLDTHANNKNNIKKKNEENAEKEPNITQSIRTKITICIFVVKSVLFFEKKNIISRLSEQKNRVQRLCFTHTFILCTKCFFFYTFTIKVFSSHRFIRTHAIC